MASPRLIARIERLAWILVYGGLLSMLLGWVTLREEAATGGWLLSAGGVAAALGVVLIIIRSGLRPAPDASQEQGNT